MPSRPPPRILMKVIIMLPDEGRPVVPDPTPDPSVILSSSWMLPPTEASASSSVSTASSTMPSRTRAQALSAARSHSLPASTSSASSFSTSSSPFATCLGSLSR